MPAVVTGTWAKFLAAVRSFSLAQKVLAVLGAGLLVAAVVALSAWLTAPKLVPLFSGVSGSDASAIVEQLRANGVEYQLSDGGSTILVPEASVYDQRMEAAAAGLPSDQSDGYSLLDDMGVTSSEFQQNVTYQRAIEGELAKTIEAIKGVDTASVKLAIPEETVFAEQTTPPTASVFVATSGSGLSSEQVQAVTNLVSASVDGLAPENVAITDSAGRVLSAVGVGATGGSDQQLADYQAQTQASVQAMLDEVVGAGNATVVVSATPTMQSGQRTTESYEVPADAPALSESTDTESYTGSGAGTGAGVLGPDNIAVPEGGTGDGTYTSESTTRNNAVDKVTEVMTIPAGEITRQTVSVAINSDAVGMVDVAGIESLVAAAAGVNIGRGDVVTVQAMPFSTAAADTAAEALRDAAAQEEADRIAGLIRTAIIAIAVVLVLAIGALILVRRSRRIADREPLDLGELAVMREAVEQQTAPTVQLRAAAEPSPLEMLDNPPSPSDRARSEIASMAVRDPDRTAELLRSLMEERSNR
ncbi:flagellar basal-body MS-ring/collar protein FliF [Desertivibrio insolitus]|uniref:flagellar basal-body MS-ring/collar protein FliF n=1 Tax=Herbiconiux sp. SYSU D00978 TaxID=2812562 RepID=UPI001A967FE1|nr:flagellar basal-body MS-ring/collar protein FliF [Herbiconiux sp. SYSU D00978]